MLSANIGTAVLMIGDGGDNDSYDSTIAGRSFGCFRNLTWTRSHIQWGYARQLLVSRRLKIFSHAGYPVDENVVMTIDVSGRPLPQQRLIILKKRQGQHVAEEKRSLALANIKCEAMARFEKSGGGKLRRPCQTKAGGLFRHT